MNKRVIRSIYFDREKLSNLEKLSAKTRVSKSVYMREGVDLVMKRYKKIFKNQKST